MRGLGGRSGCNGLEPIVLYNLAAMTLAAVTLCRDPRCHTDMKRIEIVPRGNLDAVLLTSHLLIIVYLTINRSSHIYFCSFLVYPYGALPLGGPNLSYPWGSFWG